MAGIDKGVVAIDMRMRTNGGPDLDAIVDLAS
jgi:hypothetical protein